MIGLELRARNYEECRLEIQARKYEEKHRPIGNMSNLRGLEIRGKSGDWNYEHMLLFPMGTGIMRKTYYARGFMKIS